jgi:signal transduction histidine kinase
LSTTWLSEQRCGFSVQDNGIGIARVDQDRIFDRFFRVDAARTPRDGGSGLGLSIAKSLVELHNGKIQVESAIGRGACFNVAFPCAEISRMAEETQTLS